MANTHYDLKTMASYIETHEPGLIIVGASKYMRRQILEGDNGKLYILRNIAGWDTFDTIMDAMEAIQHNKDKYSTLPESKAWKNSRGYRGISDTGEVNDRSQETSNRDGS